MVEVTEVFDVMADFQLPNGNPSLGYSHVVATELSSVVRAKMNISDVRVSGHGVMYVAFEPKRSLKVKYGEGDKVFIFPEDLVRLLHDEIDQSPTLVAGPGKVRVTETGPFIEHGKLVPHMITCSIHKTTSLRPTQADLFDHGLRLNAYADGSLWVFKPFLRASKYRSLIDVVAETLYGIE